MLRIFLTYILIIHAQLVNAQTNIDSILGLKDLDQRLMAIDHFYSKIFESKQIGEFETRIFRDGTEPERLMMKYSREFYELKEQLSDSTILIADHYLPIAKQVGHPLVTALIYFIKGRAQLTMQQFDDGLASYLYGYNLLKSDPENKFYLHDWDVFNTGFYYYIFKDYSKAISIAKEVFPSKIKVGPTKNWFNINISNLIGAAYLKSYQNDSALAWIQRSYELSLQDSSQVWIGISKGYLGMIHAQKKDFKIGIQELIAGIDTCSKYKLWDNVFPFTISLAYSYLNFGKSSKVKPVLNLAREVLRDQNLDSAKTILQSDYIIMYHRVASAFYRSTGDTKMALAHLDTAIIFENQVREKVSESGKIISEGLVANEQMERETAMARQHSKIEEERAENRLIIIFFLLILMASGAYWTVSARRQNKKIKDQAIALSETNAELDDKVREVKLLHKEMQHRVKNNLASVYSLLRMQERKEEEPSTIESLRQARVRIEGIARLQEMLSVAESGSTKEFDLTNFLKETVTQIVQSFGWSEDVVLNIDSEPIKANYDRILPLVYIINEWTTNTLKYANSGSDRLQINLEVRQMEKMLTIRYSDNGLPQQDNSIKGSGLGKEIIALICNRYSYKLSTIANQQHHYLLTIHQS